MRARRDGARVQGNIGAAPARAARVNPPLLRGLFARAEDTNAHSQATRSRYACQACIPRVVVLDTHVNTRGLQELTQRQRKVIGNGQADGPTREDTRRQDTHSIYQRGSTPGTHENRSGTVAQDIALACQGGDIAVNTVIGGPRVGIGGKRATQIRHVRLGKLPAHRLTQGEHT